MIRADTFARSALFAAGAAAAWPAWWIVAAPLLGGWPALSAYLVAVTAWYLAALPAAHGGAPPRRLRIAAVTVVLGGMAAGAAHNITELAIALAVLLGIARSGILYRHAAARAVAIESVLLVAGLLFARHLSGPSAWSIALGVWGFLLVQSTYFLVGGRADRAGAPSRRDPFDDAYARAEALLDAGL